MAKTDDNDIASTVEARSNADTPTSSLIRQTTVANMGAQTKDSTSLFPLHTEPVLGEEGDETTMLTITGQGPAEQSSMAQSRTDSNIPQSTTRNSAAWKHATTGSNGNTSGGESKDGSSRTTATTSRQDGSVDRSTQKPDSESDGLNADFTTEKQYASGHVLTMTTYEDYLKNIKLNLSLDFALGDLTKEQTANLEDLSIVYGLDVSNISAY